MLSVGHVFIIVVGPLLEFPSNFGTSKCTSISTLFSNIMHFQLKHHDCVS
ncbi:hypothetical protein BofuT4_uP098410.1 [Botrytis cinerea T4]|uniref:Uncharacterized protein n=1 Tax=Botryotinia fuckeliana (strain T4) TaxID=999810 RepID=G2YCF3_BOTF4|nr:hypothetical protein BofuT4_uP098410.1 [Botrytis cinerea T4]